MRTAWWDWKVGGDAGDRPNSLTAGMSPILQIQLHPTPKNSAWEQKRTSSSVNSLLSQWIFSWTVQCCGYLRLAEYFIKTVLFFSIFFLLFLMTNLFRPKDQKPIYTFNNVTKLPSSIKSNSSLQSTCSARQHYLRQSRYLPGTSATWLCSVTN